MLQSWEAEKEPVEEAEKGQPGEKEENQESVTAGKPSEKKVFIRG